ncbi:MAG TPA: hypothetical protein VGK00_16775 [Anaerolineales bacterium]|jgi:hypothetical protein
MPALGNLLHHFSASDKGSIKFYASAFPSNFNSAMLTDELLVYIFDGQPHLLAEPMSTWLGSSRRFITFVTTFRDKIRKKLRVTQDKESILDLRLELETAYLLLREPYLNLLYEPLLSERLRGPDFAVTFTTSLTFMVEVTRLRADQQGASAEAQEQTLPAKLEPNLVPTFERLTDAIGSKLGQLQPQHSNVLLISIGATHLTQTDLRAAMLRMQQRVEHNDSAFLHRYQFRDRAAFFHHYQRLSEILVRGEQLQAAEPTISWVNPQAKHPLPDKVRKVLYHSHAI